MLEAAAVQKLPIKKVGKDAEVVKARVGEIWSKATNAEKKAAQELAGANRVTFHRAYTKGSLNLRIAVALAQVFKVNPAYLTGAANTKGTCSDKNLSAFLAEHGVTAEQAAPAADESGNTDEAGIADVAATSNASAETPAEAAVETSAKKRGARKRSAEKQGKGKQPPTRQTKRTLSVVAPVASETDEDFAEQFESFIKQSLKDEVIKYAEERGIPLDAFPALAAMSMIDELVDETPISPETQKFMDDMTEDDLTLLLKAALLRAKANVPDAVAAVSEVKRLLLSIY